jgi:primosomal protein N'
MARNPTMLSCPACGHSVSSSAMSCPSCGSILRKAKRGIFGKIAIFTFWAFNAFMVFAIWTGSRAAIDSQDALTGAEKAGAVIGTGIGISLLLAIWLIGAVILGLMALLTRAKS